MIYEVFVTQKTFVGLKLKYFVVINHMGNPHCPCNTKYCPYEVHDICDYHESSRVGVLRPVGI